MVTQLVHLPNEILHLIVTFLPNCDIKNLRLSCTHLRHQSRLRFDRVFISANPRNLQVFGAIAAHEEFRKQVVEVVWDDARLTLSAAGYWERNPFLHDEGDSEEDGDCEEDRYYKEAEAECPAWFVKACRENIVPKGVYDRRHHEEKLALRMPKPRRPLKDSYAYFMELYRQQQAILETGEDIEMFRRGLKAFPALRRVTITPIAHKQFLAPRYSTPMIRSFPAGFNYPIPEGWPTHKVFPERIGFWYDAEVKTRWRGLCAVTRELAKCSEQHHVTELVVDVNRCLTGLHHDMFRRRSPEYEDLKALFSRKGFKRIDLAMHVSRIQWCGWSSYYGLLTEALASAKDLEYFSFHTNTTGPVQWPQNPNYVPILKFFPVAQWVRLKHFGISRAIIHMPELVALFAVLPPTVQTIELSMIFFQEGGYEELLTRIRDSLDWRSRRSPPRLTINIPNELLIPSLSIWISDEVDSFLYHGGPNPFQNGSDTQVASGVGTLRHDFDDGYDRSKYSLREAGPV